VHSLEIVIYKSYEMHGEYFTKIKREVFTNFRAAWFLLDRVNIFQNDIKYGKR
jgi:hypothetical protein